MVTADSEQVHQALGCAPARGAGESIKPGVERSGTPGSHAYQFRARETGDSENAYSMSDAPDRLASIALHNVAVAHLVGSVSDPSLSCGSAALHPRLYAGARLRGLKRSVLLTSS